MSQGEANPTSTLRLINLRRNDREKLGTEAKVERSNSVQNAHKKAIAISLINRDLGFMKDHDLRRLRRCYNFEPNFDLVRLRISKKCISESYR